MSRPQDLFGVLAFSTSSFIASVLLNYPLTWDMLCWYANRSTLAIVVVAIAAYGFRYSLGKQSPAPIPCEAPVTIATFLVSAKSVTPLPSGLTRRCESNASISVRSYE